MGMSFRQQLKSAGVPDSVIRRYYLYKCTSAYVRWTYRQSVRCLLAALILGLADGTLPQDSGFRGLFIMGTLLAIVMALWEVVEGTYYWCVMRKHDQHKLRRMASS